MKRFVAQNGERVHLAAQFSQLTTGREWIIKRAVSGPGGGSPAKVTKQIAQETSRSVETVRYTLRRFKKAHPDLAIFPYHDGRLPTEAMWEIYRQYRRGESVQALAQPVHQPRTRIYRIINEMRGARIMDLPLDHIGNEQFARLRSQKEEAEIWGRCRKPICGRRSRGRPAVCPRIWPASTRCHC